jgi:hypothetical protein
MCTSKALHEMGFGSDWKIIIVSTYSCSNVNRPRLIGVGTFSFYTES